MNGGRLEIQTETGICNTKQKKELEIEKCDAENALTATVSSAHKRRSIHNSYFFRNCKFPSFTWNFFFFFLQYRHILMIKDECKDFAW